MKVVVLITVLALTPVLAGGGEALDRCDLVTRQGAEKVLGEPITGVVTGDEFCTWLSDGPVLVAAMNEYDSKDQARDKMAADRRRRETEGKTVTTVKGFGESAHKAVTTNGIELAALDGTRVIQLAVAGDDVTPSRYEERIGSMMRSLLSRRPVL